MHDPRALAVIFEKAEAELAARLHPDPYRREFQGFPACGSLSLIFFP